MMILHKMTIKWLLLHSRIGFKDYDFEYENDHWRRRWWEERRPSPGASKSSSSAPRTRRWPSTYYVITTTRMMVTFGKKNARNCSLTRSSRALSALWGRWQTWCSSSLRWAPSFFKASPTNQLLTWQSQEPGHSAVSASLSSLTAAATHFETECRMLILRFQLVLDLIMIMFMLLTIGTFKFLKYGLYLSYLS